MRGPFSPRVMNFQVSALCSERAHLRTDGTPKTQGTRQWGAAWRRAAERGGGTRALGRAASLK